MKRTFCVAGAPNDVNYRNNTHTQGISTQYFPKDVAVWSKFVIKVKHFRELTNILTPEQCETNAKRPLAESL